MIQAAAALPGDGVPGRFLLEARTKKASIRWKPLSKRRGPPSAEVQVTGSSGSEIDRTSALVSGNGLVVA